MTTTEINTMEAGTDTDVAVIAACISIDDLREFAERVGIHCGFNPSTDWNAAMYAAEKFGLFDEQRTHAGLARFDNQWHVMEWVGGGEFDDDYGVADSGPLAICRAILTLANRDA